MQPTRQRRGFLLRPSPSSIGNDSIYPVARPRPRRKGPHFCSCVRLLITFTTVLVAVVLLVTDVALLKMISKSLLHANMQGLQNYDLASGHRDKASNSTNKSAVFLQSKQENSNYNSLSKVRHVVKNKVNMTIRE
jgi:hypothetical protein